ncbi:MAG: AAA family ATPase [Acidimicrobiia bacterium]|nr:AAA family ATPase [Acidimicrobiia bacterium]MYG59076.1 AAA family ATPase [Acidimicrobiia bacterium]MYJ33210.1 AAA family ATPase [Acidimicrobiia bacterium]
MRPEYLFVITGTSTEIGKTWVGANLAVELRRRGATVAARKPVQSYDPDEFGSTDAEVLARATGESPQMVCRPSHSLPLPLAPPMAAAELRQACPTFEAILASCAFDRQLDIGLVEGVGGLLSPIAEHSDTLDLIDALNPSCVVVVTDARLGVIHNVRAISTALGSRSHIIFLNRFDGSSQLHRLNDSWLRDQGFEVTTTIAELADALTTATDHDLKYRMSLLSDTPTVRITQHEIAPGGETGWHRHEFPYTVTPLRTAVVNITNPEGETSIFEMVAGESYDRPAGIEHNLTNSGTSNVSFIEVERR